MFRKTITRLAYSPSLAEGLATYAKRLKQEEVKRQIGLVFVILALVVQSFAVFFPPESANAGNATDFIEGGVSTISDYLSYYDQGTHDIKPLLASLGISRSDLLAARAASLTASANLLLWKAASRGDGDDTPYDFVSGDGTTKTAYYQPFTVPSTLSVASTAAFTGFSSSAGWFALLKGSGDLVTTTSVLGTCAPRPNLPAIVPAPLSFSDIRQCGVKITSSISARNLTLGTPAVSRDARASDRILYTLTLTNNDKYAISIPLSIGLTDVLEYSQLIDKGGADFNQGTKTLTWPVAAIAPGTSLTRSFIIEVLPVIPSTAIGRHDPSSYDCTMATSFGETLRIPIACPFPKAIERIVSELPSTSLPTNVIFALIVAVVSLYFYVRSRQLRTELRLIRHNYQGNL